MVLLQSLLELTLQDAAVCIRNHCWKLEDVHVLPHVEDYGNSLALAGGYAMCVEHFADSEQTHPVDETCSILHRAVFRVLRDRFVRAHPFHSICLEEEVQVLDVIE